MPSLIEIEECGLGILALFTPRRCCCCLRDGGGFLNMQPARKSAFSLIIQRLIMLPHSVKFSIILFNDLGVVMDVLVVGSGEKKNFHSLQFYFFNG